VLARHRRYGQGPGCLGRFELPLAWNLAGHKFAAFPGVIGERSPLGQHPGSVAAPGQEREPVMGLGKKAKDKAKVIKGKTKKQAGKATGNKRLKAKGRAGEATGKLKLKGRKAKNASKR
jgi:uncharacterized protein YjbJ (UPF0337 family)